MSIVVDLAEVVKEAHDGLLCVGADGVVLFGNRSAERLFGAAPGSLVGRQWGSLLELDEPGDLPKDGEGTAAPIRAYAVRDVTRARTPVELVVTLHENGAYFSAAIRARTTELAAARLTREREDFLSSAAHQLRAPIQPIMTSLRTIETALARGVDVPSDTLPRAVRQTLRLARLVEAILRDASGASPAGRAVVPVRVDVAELTSDLVEDFRLAAPGRNISFRGPTSGVFAASDREGIYQVLTSLIDNALKYSPRPAAVLVDVEPGESTVAVHVTDQGIGVPANERARVFSKFYRASNAPRAAGLGLGLYLAHQIARELQGDLEIESEEGAGSVFTLTLPRHWTTARRARVGSRAGGASSPGKEEDRGDRRAAS